ncbi:winged helix DNA-binding domain-containing protein [Actinomadura sp. HBU206391]|nr:winged helix DNA-binding domain-containing protein [Actinomadura sp. HBU206391]
MPALEAVRHLVGLQAQLPDPPYIGLWTRLAGFRQDALTRLLFDRQVVRSSVLRGTQHLVAAQDFPWLRPLMQPALDRGRQAAFGRSTAGLDLAELTAVGRALLAGRTLTRPRLGELLAEHGRAAGWGERDPQALAWSVQCLVPLIHAPPNGTWGKGGATPFMLAEDWLGRPVRSADQLVRRPQSPPESPLDGSDGSPDGGPDGGADGGPADSTERMIRRYLAAFGPASVKDMQVWSGLTRLNATVERLRPHLRVFRAETGMELFDLPGAPLPDPETPVPVRFLPAFDNLMVAHHERDRVMTEEHRRRVISGSLVRATVLVDGFVRGVWALERGRRTATLVIEPFEPLSHGDLAAVADEGTRLLAFAAADTAAHDVRFT